MQNVQMPWKVKKDAGERLRLHLSKVCSALVQMGQNEIRIEMREDHAVIKNKLRESDFKLIKVYSNGNVHYCDALENKKLLGSAKCLPDIKEDLLTKSIE